MIFIDLIYIQLLIYICIYFRVVSSFLCIYLHSFKAISLFLSFFTDCWFLIYFDSTDCVDFVRRFQGSIVSPPLNVYNRSPLHRNGRLQIVKYTQERKSLNGRCSCENSTAPNSSRYWSISKRCEKSINRLLSKVFLSSPTHTFKASYMLHIGEKLSAFFFSIPSDFFSFSLSRPLFWISWEGSCHLLL